MIRLVCVIIFVELLLEVNKRPVFKAAVYEFSPFIYPRCVSKTVCTREEAKESMMKNIKRIEEITMKAAEEGADIIVFPEGSNIGETMARKNTVPFIQSLPKANDQGNLPNLCTHPEQQEERMEVIRELSCIAKESNTYVVANIVTGEQCNISMDTRCTDGWKMYNTDVVFSRDGDLITYYHKFNLFTREVLTYDVTEEPMVVTFDTNFGKIGVMTCFDVMFDAPALELVKHGGTTLVLPSHWVNTSPIRMGIQAHSTFAYRWGVNLLVAECMVGGESGSGIYSSDGVHALHVKNHTINQDRLLIAELPVIPYKPKFETDVKFGQYANISTTPQSPGPFTASLDRNEANLVILQSNGTARVCSEGFCCESTYMKADNHTNELYALAAFSDIHWTQQAYAEICAVVRCASTDPLSCGMDVTTASQRFNYVNLSGTFSTNYVYPSVFLDDDGNYQLPYNEVKVLPNGVLNYESKREDGGVLSVLLLGRPFDNDPTMKSYLEYIAQLMGG